MSATEIIAAILGVANIVLLVRRSIWNYPFGLAMVALYGWVFLDARLYSDAALQVFFFAIQIYGWWNWLRARGGDGAVRVGALGNAARAAWCAVIVVATIGEGWYLAHHTADAAPWMDANTTAMSVVAQYLLSVRKIENWILWIATDVVQIGLYAWKGLYPTTMLYVLFLVLSAAGLWEWRRQLAPAAAQGAPA
ncbi:MAG: nicotinamide riboside transporter PnuC [Rhizomicrobium sp.]